MKCRVSIRTSTPSWPHRPTWSKSSASLIRNSSRCAPSATAPRTEPNRGGGTPTRLASASLSTLFFSMNDILNKSTVLVLNRHWQAIHVKTPAEAFCMIASGAATALDVQSDEYISPVRWNDWLKLPVREHDNAVNTPRGPCACPPSSSLLTTPRSHSAARASAPAASGSATAASANTPAANSRRKKATSTTSSRAPAAANPLPSSCNGGLRVPCF